MRIHGALVLVPFQLVMAEHAGASEPFPEALSKAVPSIGCIPQCTLCHQTNLGGIPADKPFAMSLKRAGDIPFRNTAVLNERLETLRATSPALDSDGDGNADYAELSAGSDPNSADSSINLCGVEGPRYGCGAHVATRPPPQGGWLALVLGTALLGSVWLRRRASSPR